MSLTPSLYGTESMTKVAQYVKPGDTVELVLPHSEVCCHMRVAGKLAQVEVTTGTYPAAQIRRKDGQPYSFPVGLGEGGLFRDDTGIYHYPLTEAEKNEADWLL